MPTPKEVSRLQKRRGHGLTYRDLGNEFNRSHTWAYRALKQANDAVEDGANKSDKIADEGVKL